MALHHQTKIRARSEKSICGVDEKSEKIGSGIAENLQKVLIFTLRDIWWCRLNAESVTQKGSDWIYSALSSYEIDVNIKIGSLFCPFFILIGRLLQSPGHRLSSRRTPVAMPVILNPLQQFLSHITDSNSTSSP